MRKNDYLCASWLSFTSLSCSGLSGFQLEGAMAIQNHAMT